MRGTLIGFDFGTVRIGVAVGELETRMAQPLSVIDGEANALRFTAIEKLIAEWQPVAFVVGLPTAPDGTPHDMTARCQRFGNQLQGRYRLPVYWVDFGRSRRNAARSQARCSRAQATCRRPGRTAHFAILSGHPCP